MRTRTRTILVGLVVAAALVGGVAWATGTISSVVAADGTINGCYRAANGDDEKAGQGQLRVVPAAERCKKNELAIQWSQQGPKGERGLQGIQGAVGPQGAKGDTGAQGVAGLAGSNGAPGARGETGAKGDPCLATDPACRGPKGDDGTDGTNGAAGPQGPPGAAGGSLSSLDTLNGIACNAADTPGTIEVTYGLPPAGAVTLACKPNPRFILSLTVNETRTGFNTYATGRIRCGSVNVLCTPSYPAGSQVSLFALPLNGAVFTGWSGACSGTGSCVVTMNADTSVTASFGPPPA